MGSETNLITTCIGFGLSATFIVFVCTRIICGRLRGPLGSRTMYGFQSRSTDIERPEYHGNDPEPSFVAAIPTLKFNQEAFSSIQCTQCVICLADYKEKEVLRIIPYCGHNFHLSCIDIWLRKQSTCPVCRLPLHNIASDQEKDMRPVTFTISQSIDEFDTTSERSIGDERQVVEPNARSDSLQLTSSREPETMSAS